MPRCSALRDFDFTRLFLVRIHSLNFSSTTLTEGEDDTLSISLEGTISEYCLGHNRLVVMIEARRYVKNGVISEIAPPSTHSGVSNSYSYIFSHSGSLIPKSNFMRKEPCLPIRILELLFSP